MTIKTRELGLSFKEIKGRKEKVEQKANTKLDEVMKGIPPPTLHIIYCSRWRTLSGPVSQLNKDKR